MKFRTAKIDDLKILNTISVKAKAYWGYPEDWLEKWKDDLTLDESKFSKQNIVVLELQDQISGFCSVGENEDSYEILHLWLLPGHIGKGYGKKLLDEAINRFTRKDKPIKVEADPNAEPFYERLGFVTFDKVESFPKGRYLPVMRKMFS
ncbi:MAG: GNAT family N-acetyltransferase [Cyclobacteriaceae bacterium]